MATRKHRTSSVRERELKHLLTIERSVEALLSKTHNGYSGRYNFLKGIKPDLLRERIVLEAAISGDPEAAQLRNPRHAKRDSVRVSRADTVGK